jgi:hypothetical protein
MSSGRLDALRAVVLRPGADRHRHHPLGRVGRQEWKQLRRIVFARAQPLSKARNARLRKALFLPTQTAVRFNPILRGFFRRLVVAGKPKMQAIGACLRKLVMICYGVLKNRAPFDPDWASKKAP